MEMIDGLGMYANPLKLGSPALAVRLIFTPVTLNPVRELSPGQLSVEVHHTVQRFCEQRTWICACRVVVDVDDWKFAFVELGPSC